MKKTTQPVVLLAALFLFVSLNALKAQTSTSQASYGDMVVANPNAEKDIKIVSDYVNALVAGDLDKAKSLATNNYVGYGPSATDSATIDQTITGWKENNARQSNRIVKFVPETFKVTSGDSQGEWVSLWGQYSFTENGKDVKFPFQYTAHLTDGKIDKDLTYYDRLSILQTLGYTVTPPPGTK